MAFAPVRLIAIDIDGTLVNGATGPVSRRNQQALLDAEAAGICVAIATGRRHIYAMQVLHAIGLDPETILISSNGAMARRFGGELLKCASMEMEVARALVPLLRGLGITVFTFDDKTDSDRSYMVTESLEPVHSRIDLWVKANRDHLSAVEPLEDALQAELAPGRLLVQGMCAGTIENIIEAEQRVLESSIYERLSMHRTEYTEWDMAFLDLMPQGISKGVALRQLAELLKIPSEQVMAIGDNWNDLEMLEFSGQAVVMGNAVAELQTLAVERGWQITAANDLDGVAVAIEAVLAAARA
jgi:hypothetical protein